MIQYFVEHDTIEEVKEICANLNLTKRRISSGNFENSLDEYKRCSNNFKDISKIANSIKDEKFANSQYVFRKYFLLFCNLMEYFDLLKNKRYRDSWNKLQDCIDDAQYVGRFANNRFDIPDVLDLLRSYESLYPYTVFISSEYIITRSHCSLCGKSMQSLDCPHIKGDLYWGKPAIEIVDEIKEFQAACLVSHPEDKRCIIEAVDDKRTESDKFQKLDQFLGLDLPFLQRFSIRSIIEKRKRQDIIEVGRNDICPCGSGKKFKRCCLNKMYYNHEKNIVIPKGIVHLIYF